MRISWVVVGLLLAVSARASATDAQEEARSILDRAIQAHGGAEKLAKLGSVRRKLKSTVWINGNAVPVTVERTDHPPGRSKVEQRLELDGQAITTTSVLNGDKAWTNFNGDTQEARAEFRARKQVELYLLWVESLVPVRKDKAFSLSPLGEIKVDDRPAVGIKVTSKGRPDVDLYFDKESGLLVKSAYRGLDEFEKEVVTECFFRDYKETVGLKRPTKFHFLRDGVKTSEHEVVETTFEEKLEDSEFAKP
jgi:hypothetical protein